jgi:polysaccharide biosynthesis/export protein
MVRSPLFASPAGDADCSDSTARAIASRQSDGRRSCTPECYPDSPCSRIVCSELERIAGPSHLVAIVAYLHPARGERWQMSRSQLGVGATITGKLSLLFSRGTFAALGGLASLFLSAGCSTSTSSPAAPRVVDQPALRYKIGPLDTLNIIVWRNPELSSTITVRPDGYATMPLVEDIQAAGKNPAELSRDIEKVLGKIIREPVVSIIVTGFQGIYSEQIRIVGEAAHPQAIPYRQDMTILDVMIQAGGLTDFADGNSAVLIRGAETGKQYSVRLKDLLKRGDISANAAVLPGDIIIIPQSWF